MLLVLVRDYKSANNLYVNGFVHSRILSYLKKGIETRVFVLNSAKAACAYSIEGVEVEVGNQSEFVKFLANNSNVNSILVHFIDKDIVNALNQIDRILNVVVFVHGNEALHWYQRIFPGIFSSAKKFFGFIKYIFSNTADIISIKKFFKKTNHNLSFITVSNWMKDKAEKTWRCKGKYHWNIIPNIIDSSLFKF